MKAHRAAAAACAAWLSGCALAGSYDFDGYSQAPSGTAGASGAAAGAAGGAGAKAGGGQSGAGQAGASAGNGGTGGTVQAGAAGAGQAGAAGASGEAGSGGAGQGGAAAGSPGLGGGAQGGQAAGGAGQAGAGQAGAGQAGAGQAGAGQAGAGQAGAGQAGSGGCGQPKTWYRDGDFDGHGTPLLSSVTSCDKPADEPGVQQWVLVADDCNDANKDVFPGQTAYFGTPYAKPGAPGDVSFDYDCNNEETPTAQTFAPACSGLALGACSGTGYVPYSPARSGAGIGSYCGSTHTISCVKQALFCVDGGKTAAAPLACH